MKMITRTTVALAALLMPLIALAHPGHGQGSPIMHDAEHLVWLLAGLVVVTLVYTLVKPKLAARMAARQRINKR
ncbi:hypothetical protein [Halioxenophilus sp. WMMB6]|uniref:hypothetical protein n=1 Tax=Halioxenophilus sp. WMMB6 TaxID=3073815 RepID=UPI00295F50B9|nr:hypothetical protein [Halioxenophilus sp. WMMB6]